MYVHVCTLKFVIYFQYKDGWFLGNSTNIDAHDLFEKFTFNLSELIKEVRISTGDSNNPKITISFEDGAQGNETIAKWVVKYDRTFGLCYSMQLTDYVTQKGVFNVEIRPR